MAIASDQLPQRNTARYYFDAWTLDGTFVRINDTLRLSKDYEQGEVYSASMVYLASIGSLLRRVAANGGTAARYQRTRTAA